jgi:hypothetical protein
VKTLRSAIVPLVVLAGMIVSASAAQAGSRVGTIGIRVADSPSATSGLERSYIVDRVDPGGTVHRRLELSNTTQSAVSVAVYPAAASTRRGRFAFAPGHRANDLSSWTSVSRGRVLLQPGATASELITIDVAEDATPGEHYAVLWAEVAAAGGPGRSVRLVNRVGIRMYLSIGPGGGAAPSFTVGRLVATRSVTGKPIVTATVRNTGGRRLALTGSVSLADGPGGIRAGPFAVDTGASVAGGLSALVFATLDRQLPRGPWHAELEIGSGALHHRVTGTITFPSVSVAPARKRQLPPVLLGVFAFCGLAVTAAGVVFVGRG